MSDIRRMWCRRTIAEIDARMKPWLETLCKQALSRETRKSAASPESIAQMNYAMRAVGCAFIDATDAVGVLIAALIERGEQLEADRAHYTGDAGNDSCAAVLAERDQLKAELDEAIKKAAQWWLACRNRDSHAQDDISQAEAEKMMRAHIRLRTDAALQKRPPE